MILDVRGTSFQRKRLTPLTADHNERFSCLSREIQHDPETRQPFVDDIFNFLVRWYMHVFIIPCSLRSRILPLYVAGRCCWTLGPTIGRPRCRFRNRKNLRAAGMLNESSRRDGKNCWTNGKAARSVPLAAFWSDFRNDPWQPTSYSERLSFVTVTRVCGNWTIISLSLLSKPNNLTSVKKEMSKFNWKNCARSFPKLTKRNIWLTMLPSEIGREERNRGKK